MPLIDTDVLTASSQLRLQAENRELRGRLARLVSQYEKVCREKDQEIRVLREKVKQHSRRRWWSKRID